MSEIMRLSTQEARTDPEATFTSPTEMVEHIGLTRGEKIAALKRWASTVRQRLDAVNEGMEPGAGEAYVEDCVLFRKIKQALESLREPDDTQSPVA